MRSFLYGFDTARVILPVSPDARFPVVAQSVGDQGLTVNEICLTLEVRVEVRCPPAGIHLDGAHAQIPAHPEPSVAPARVVAQCQLGSDPAPRRHDQRIRNLGISGVTGARRSDERKSLCGIGKLQSIDGAVAQFVGSQQWLAGKRLGISAAQRLERVTDTR